MRTPKQWLQKWLGIEAVATRVAEIDLELHPPDATLGYTGNLYGIPVDDENDTVVHEPLYFQSDEVLEFKPLTRAIKKGYDEPE